jgi:hypothetical protein
MTLKGTESLLICRLLAIALMRRLLGLGKVMLHVGKRRTEHGWWAEEGSWAGGDSVYT